MASRAQILKLAKLYKANKKKGGGNGESSKEESTEEFTAEPLYKLELYHKDDPHYKV